MANEEHVKILRQGVDVWNKWRVRNHNVPVDLSRIDLSHSTLNEIDLYNVNLENADLSYTDFSYANFSGANLSNSIFINADLTSAKFIYSNLTGANFVSSDMVDTDLTDAKLNDAKLDGADLSYANMHNTWLRETDFSNAIFQGTVIADCDLSNAKGLDNVVHLGPSTIGIDTLLRSGKLPEQFLRGCGLPQTTIENLPYIINVPAIELYSCFISYSTTDDDFAMLLKETLYDAGVNCYFAPEQMLPGQGIDDEITYGIRHWDKVLFCASKSSLTEKWWVDYEKDLAFKKERDLQRERGEPVSILIPLNLDGYLFSDEFKSHPHRGIFEVRLAADFVGWQTDRDKFNREVQKVIRALRTDGGRTPPPKSKL